MDRRYIRKGTCKQCGDCCLKEDCEHLTFDKDKAICKIHSEERPPKCGQYPEDPPVMSNRCGYYFIDTYNDDAVVKDILKR